MKTWDNLYTTERQVNEVKISTVNADQNEDLKVTYEQEINQYYINDVKHIVLSSK